MRSDQTIDAIDARLILALNEHPRATTIALAEQIGLSRNTVQARLAKLDRQGALAPFERRVDPEALGYPLKAFIVVQVTQSRLAEVSEALVAIPEVLEVHGLTGPTDLLVHVVATDADHLYGIAGKILASPGVERTNTSLVMRDLVPYRLTPLLRRIAEG
ncbi:Lrp/AsnC family transcriptional regulator [Streptosporangium sp. NPDC000396]|uniref:Lrp/AsnC family transcriptional regulator n=1 Tax=Streptosporangium sp. NPDC000396 TaxID=3366185 RepID=UPI003684AF36